MRFTRTLAAAAAAAISVAGLSACTPGDSGPDEELVLRIADVAPPGTFDVAGFIGGFASNAVYDSLVVGNPPDIEPWLAESFSYNDDRTVLTLEIRDDVTFIDGERLDAEVVKQNIDLQRGPDGLDSPFYTAIEDVVVTGDYTVEVRLSRADVDILNWMGKPVVSPAAIDDREGLAETPVGSGPYILQSNDSDASYTFVRNEDYWNPEAFPFDRIELTIIPDITARLNALKSGQVDFAPIDVQTAAEAEASGLEITSYSSQWVGLVLGDRRGEISPPLADVRVRQAIVMALDREGFAEAVGGGYGDPSNQVGVEGQEGYYIPELADLYSYDIEAARELLAEAGYPDGFDIRIPTHAFLEKYQPYLDQAFEDLGIRVEWAKVGDEAFFDEWLTGKNAAFPIPSGFWDLSFVKADGQWNKWGNTDPETEALLEQINTGDEEEWLEARTRLTEKILREAWYAILAHEPAIWAYDPGIEVTDITPYGAILLHYLAPAD